MSTKINFAPEGTTVNNNDILDSGLGYSLERGFGWVTQFSLDQGNPTPIDITTNTRDRNEGDTSNSDSLIHLQYPEELTEFQPLSNTTASGWEYNLANGQYFVQVSVGDINYTDSNHIINVEGNTLVAGFVPTENRKFATAVDVVTIDDGKLTIDANGGYNTKLNYVKITPAEAIKVNFGVAGNTPDGYIQDSGGAYSSPSGFGWVTQASFGTNQAIPIDVSSNTRDRASAAIDALDTLVHFQYQTPYGDPNSQTTPAAWEYNLSNGEYLVKVNVGDANYTDSNHVINVEGENIISGFTPAANQLFQSGEKLVTVRDGKLSVDAIGGYNTKINSIEITPAVLLESNTNQFNFPENAIYINFGTPITAISSDFIQDIGQGFDSNKGYGWVTQDSLATGQPQAVDVVTNGRDRSGVNGNVILDSLIHLQYPTALNDFSSVATPAAWEYELENGQYEVTVSVGDSQYTDSNHVINIENHNVISGFVPSASELFTTGTATVEVSDGKLTIDAIGGENTKLNYVSIVPVDSNFM